VTKGIPAQKQLLIEKFGGAKPRELSLFGHRFRCAGKKLAFAAQNAGREPAEISRVAEARIFREDKARMLGFVLTAMDRR
jgi:hypothetical protein